MFLALFFPQLRVFNNFSALFSGLFRFVFGGQTFVISNFSALFFKITSFLSHLSQKTRKLALFRAVTCVPLPDAREPADTGRSKARRSSAGHHKAIILAHKSQENSWRLSLQSEKFLYEQSRKFRWEW